MTRRVPNPRVARSPLLWSVLAAYGAGFFVATTLSVAFVLLARALGLPLQWLGAIVTIAGTGARFAVASASGGRDAVILVAAILIVDQVLALPGIFLFCSRIASSAPTCSLPTYILNLWPEATGAVIAFGVLRWLRAAEGDRNPVLESAGALALTQLLANRIVGAVVISSTPFEASLLFLVAALAGGLACGLVLVRRVPPVRQWPVLGLIALASLGGWLLISVPPFVETIGIGRGLPMSGLAFLVVASPVIAIAAAALVLYMAAARNVKTEAAR